MGRFWPLVLLLLVAAPLRADDYIFKWVDRQGVVHITDRIGDVPEPYRSLYAEEVRRREQQRNSSGASEEKAPAGQRPQARTPRESSPPKLADQIAKERAKWKKRVADWRKRLLDATNAVAAIDAKLAETRANPVLRHTPRVKEEVAALAARRAKAVENVETARAMLLEKLPAEARKEGVPPKWLQ